MSLSREIGDIKVRYKIYIDRLIALFKQHNIKSVPSLIQAIRSNSEFSKEWKIIWREIADADGGKLSLTTVGVLLGAVLGGVGIAAMGSAFGLPLALVLGLGGFLAGTEIDTVRRLTDSRLTMIKLPKDVYARIKAVAETADISTSAVILQALSAAFPDPSALEIDE